MATYTDNYQLTKPLYSETADVSVINNNMDKVDDIMHNSQISLADAYDQTQTYELGEKVMYEMLLYRCISRIETPEVWNPSHWERTTAADEGGNYVDVDEKFQTGLNVADVDIDGDQHSIKVPYMTGATLLADGAGGLVPAPEAGDKDKFLKGDGSWDDVPAGGSTVTITPETIAEPKAKVADYSIDGVSGSIYAPIIQIDGKASGAVASFSDGSANPIKSIDIGIVPLQSGSGDPSPNNNRPISGWTGAKIYGRGYNLYDGLYESGTYDQTTGEKTASSSLSRNINPIPCKPNINIYFNRASGEGRIFYYDEQMNLLDSYYFINAMALTTPSNCAFFNFALSNNIYSDSISINYPSTNTDINTYNGTTYTIPFEDSQGDPLTIYGGEIHIRRVNGVWSGEVVDDRKCVTLRNDTTVTCPEAGVIWLSPSDIQVPSESTVDLVKSSHYKSDIQGHNIDGTIVKTKNNKVILIRDATNATTENDYKAYVEAQYGLGNPVQVWYKIATPNTYPIDPANIPNIVTLLDDNNMFADTGDIDEVIYIRDLNLAFNELWDLVHSNSGTRSLSLSKGATEEEEKKEEEKKEEPTEEEPKEEKR